MSAGLSLSYDGSYLLSNAMDATLRIWDVRPFAPSERCVKLFSGHQHGFERNLLRCAWSRDGSKVRSLSSTNRTEKVFLVMFLFCSQRMVYEADTEM